jgi:hypothetical protein
MDPKLTAMQYLVDNLWGLKHPKFEHTKKILEEALIMEKEQMIEAMVNCQIIEDIDYIDGSITFANNPNQFFKETYNIKI